MTEHGVSVTNTNANTAVTTLQTAPAGAATTVVTLPGGAVSTVTSAVSPPKTVSTGSATAVPTGPVQFTGGAGKKSGGAMAVVVAVVAMVL